MVRLYALVRVSLSVIANDGQLEVFPLKSIDQQDDVANYENEPYSKPNQVCKKAQEREITDNIENNLYNRQATEEED